MANTIPSFNKKPECLKITKVETTYEYVPILGGLLGWWRKQSQLRLGDTIELHLAHSLSEYDLLIINGVEIPIPEEALTDKKNR